MFFDRSNSCNTLHTGMRLLNNTSSPEAQIRFSDKRRRQRWTKWEVLCTIVCIVSTTALVHLQIPRQCSGHLINPTCPSCLNRAWRVSNSRPTGLDVTYCNDLQCLATTKTFARIVLSSKKALYTANDERRAELAGRISNMDELLIKVISGLTANLETRVKAHMASPAPSTAQSRVFAAEICQYLGSALLVNALFVLRVGELVYMDVNDNFRPVLGLEGDIQYYVCDYVSGMLKGRSTRGPGPAPLRFHHSLNWLISVYLSTFRPLLVGTTVGLQNKGPLLLQPNLERINSAWLRKSWRRFVTPFLPEEAKTMTPHHARHAQTDALNRMYPSLYSAFSEINCDQSL
jgi:hypothetical protein